MVLARPDLFKVTGDDGRDGVEHCPVFDGPVDPCAGIIGKDGLDGRIVRFERTVVEVRRVRQGECGAITRQFDIEEPPGDFTGSARRGGRAVLDGVFQCDEDPHLGAVVTVVDEDGSLAKQVTMLLDDEIDGGIKQAVARTDERCGDQSVAGQAGLVERDPFILGLDGLPGTDGAVAGPDRLRDVGDLVATGLALSCATTQSGEGFQEEVADVVGLEPPQLGTGHVLPEPMDDPNIERVLGDGTSLDQ